MGRRSGVWFRSETDALYQGRLYRLRKNALPENST
jgi:hypothetical protein